MQGGKACLIAAVTSAALLLLGARAEAQQPQPTIVQVPSDGNAEKRGEAHLQVLEDVNLEKGEGPISANLGDLLSKSSGAGLDKIHITGRARHVASSRAGIGQVVWTSVSIDDDGEKRSSPLTNPLKTSFPTKSSKIRAGTRLKAEGDIDGLLQTARGLLKRKTAEKKEESRLTTHASTSSSAPSLGSGGATNDIARSYQLSQPPTAPAPAPRTAADPPSPNLSVTSNGCEPRVDEAGGFVVIQSQTLSNGQASGSGCTDTAERIPIQKAYGTCPDLVSSSSAQPQYKEFWVASNGTTNFIGDCRPDTSINFSITTETAACPASADLTSLSWVTNGEQVYTNRNNQVVVVQPCRPVSQTPLQTGKDFTACSPQIDLTKGIVSPQFKPWYVDPTTQQRQFYAGCQPDLTVATAIQTDFAACPDKVGSTTAQRQVREFYIDPSGARINIGACMADDLTSYPIQTTSQGCSDFVDQTKPLAEAESRQFYVNAQGQSVTVKDCAPDPSQPFAVQKDYGACPVLINQAAGIAQEVFQLFYNDAAKTRQNVGDCTPDPNRQYVIQRDYSVCVDSVDLANLKAYAQYATFYIDIAGASHPVNRQCTPNTDTFPILWDPTVCHFAVDTSSLKAQEQAQLYYLNRLSVRVMVRDCSPDPTPPVPVVFTALGCSLRMDFTNLVAIQQKKYQYTKPDDTVVDATQCADSTETYAMSAVYGVCPDLVLSDNSAAFKQVRMQISPPSGAEFVTDCQPSTAAGDKPTPTTTTAGCETTFFNYIDQLQSFGSWKFYYQFAGGPQIFLTGCVQSTTAYPIESDIEGYLYNDPQKTALPKTALFITPPVGRVDVSPPQVRAGAPNIAYTFEKTTTNLVPNTNFWQGCEGFQQTQMTDTYLRPDKTEVAYVTGPGPNQDLGDQCTRITQTQTIYYDTVVSGGPAAIYLAGPGVYTGRAPGAYTDLQSGNSCLSQSTSDVTVQNFSVQQSRIATTLPAGAGGTTSFSAWSNSGSPFFTGGYSCPGNRGGAGNDGRG